MQWVVVRLQCRAQMTYWNCYCFSKADILLHNLYKNGNNCLCNAWDWLESGLNEKNHMLTINKHDIFNRADTQMISCQLSPMAPASSPHNNDVPPCSMPMNTPAKRPQTSPGAALPAPLWPVSVPVHVTSDPSVDPITSRTLTGVSSMLLTAGR